MAPNFVEDRRRAALEVYEAQETPTWRRSGFWTTTLRGLDLDALEPRRYEPGGLAVMLEPRRRRARGPDRAARRERRALGPERRPASSSCRSSRRWRSTPSWSRSTSAKRLPVRRGQVRRRHGRVLDRRRVHPRARRTCAIEKPIQVVWLIDEPGTVAVGPHAGRGGRARRVSSIREFFLGARLRGPGASRRRVRAVRTTRAPRSTSRTTRTGAAADVLRPLHPQGRGRAATRA